MDRERSPRRSPKHNVAQSQMSWVQGKARPTIIMQPNHLQWSPNPALMRALGGLWDQSQAPPPPAHAQQHAAVVPYAARSWKRIRTASTHGSTSGTRTVSALALPYRTQLLQVECRMEKDPDSKHPWLDLRYWDSSALSYPVNFSRILNFWIPGAFQGCP